ncbi:hypothetical protein B7L70_09615 [Vulcanisaeta sp. EB80]|uniref:hypothetical protein n=1 Tax=Vulcanisaeta sp. EB80 TaxID=1650660 RepID=UPI0009C09C4E|nr:hypothetical protein [Vulcanisaeta sp. EB80]PLC66885.1 hypothetical protein B7L70_09615 [Vulcanisaeta sp. EB80]
MYLDRELASYIILGLIIGLALGYIIGFYIPIPGATHLKTVTVVNSTTITIPINVTKTEVITTTIPENGKIETVTMTTTYVEVTTTTSVVNNTITKIIVVPTTTTVSNTTTITSTSLIPYPYTTTVTTTVIENASQLPGLNMSDPLSVLNWAKATYALSAFGVMNLTLPLGFCEGTMWIFPNMSAVWLGAWFIPNNLAQEYMNQTNYLGSFPTGVAEYATSTEPYLGMIDPVGGGLDTFESSSAYILSNAVNYPIPNYTLAILGTNTIGAVPPWGLGQYPFAFRYLNNGTYVMILTNKFTTGVAIQLALNPPALCVIQVIRVKPGTPDSYILNMTFLGAQYWAWVVTKAKYGKPAPCYDPAGWTYGSWVYRLNITEPIGANWQYYCGPKGIWLPLKP